MNPAIKKLGYIPEAILINVPDAFFNHKGKIEGDREIAFRKFYEQMGKSDNSEDCFYHFISSIPTVEQIQYVYVCFKGYVQYRAILVQFLRNQPVMLPGYQHPEPRNWCVTTGPVIKALENNFPMKGFRGFKYTKQLF